MIEQVKYVNNDQSSVEAVIDGITMSVPADPTNREYRKILAWVKGGGVIGAYVAPAPPTDSERIDAAFPQSDVARVIFEALFELTNRVIALEGGQAVTRAQLRTWLKGKLPAL